MDENQKLTITNFITKFNNGAFTSPDLKTQCDAGWFDWFCDESSLRNKTYKLASIVKRLAKSPKVNPDTSYVFFKNNCPVNGSLYDSFSIVDLKSENVLFHITPKSGFNSKKDLAEVSGPENNFEKPLVSGSLKDVYEYFNV